MEQKSVAKNTSYLSVSYIAQKLLSFAYFVLVARFIGVEDIGKYTFALSFTTMFAVFIDFGLTNAMIRELAKYWEKANKYLSAIISVKSLLALIVYSLVVLTVNLLGYPPITKTLVYLSGLIMVLDSFTLTFWGVFRGRQNLFFEATGVIINQVLIISTGIAVLYSRLTLPYLMVPFIVGSLFNCLYSFFMVRRQLKFRLTAKFDKTLFLALLKIAAPLALIAIFSRIYGYIDQIMLSALVGDKELGWYSTAMKIPIALQFIPAAFAAAIFPAFSTYYHSDKQQLRKSFQRSLMLLTVFAIPISFGIMAIARDVVGTFFGAEFMNSVWPLQILIIGLIFIFLNFPLGSLLNGCDRQVTNTKLVGSMMVVNIALNIILIPRFGYLGAAVTSVFCNGLLFVASLIVAKQIINYDHWQLLKIIIKTVISAGAMAAVIIYLKQFVNFLILIPLGMLVYGALLYFIKGFTKEDIHFLMFSLFKKKIN